MMIILVGIILGFIKLRVGGLDDNFLILEKQQATLLTFAKSLRLQKNLKIHAFYPKPVLNQM